jgi:3-hydroxybutyryl-CoA dehydrogenase
VVSIRKVGVLGCGLMGSGIAQVCAQKGFKTTVVEIDEKILRNGLDKVRMVLERAVAKGKMPKAEADTALANLSGSLKLEDVKDCDLVIEAITENLEEKKRVWKALDAVCPPQTIFATNTSSLCVIEMAGVTKRPERFLGLHFFNPVPMMKLVEIVRTVATADDVHGEMKSFAEAIGKEAVTAKDTPGFIVNRLLVPYLLDAIRVLEAGLASKEDIDKGMRLGCGYPMGPLELVDFVGLLHRKDNVRRVRRAEVQLAGAAEEDGAGGAPRPEGRPWFLRLFAIAFEAMGACFFAEVFRCPRLFVLCLC